jgi:hypothetical protein
MERAEQGAFAPNILGLHEAYNDMLAFHDHLRRGQVLNYEFDGRLNQLDHTAWAWSGVAVDDRAIVRTVSFSGRQTRTITVFDKPFELTFRQEGDFYWVKPDGSVTRIDY